MAIVTQEEIDATQNTFYSVTTSDTEALPTRLGKKRRTALVLTPTSAGVTVYVSLGDTPAAVGTGIPLQANQPFADSDSGDTYKCWQGAVRVIGSGAGNLAITEKF